MSDIRKLLDTINEMATTSGSVASVASPMGGVKSRKKDSIFYEGSTCKSCGCDPCKCDTSEGNKIDGTKTPDAPKVSEFGLWKNSALIGQEQRDKKRSKKQVSEGEDLAWDDPDLIKARKLIAAKKKDGHTEFKGIDRAISKLKSKDKSTRLHPTNEPKKVKEDKKEYNALDDVQDAIKRMAHRHREETANWSVEKSRALNKKLAKRTEHDKSKLDELGNSLMPGGQRKLRLAQENSNPNRFDPRASRRHPGAVDENIVDTARDAVKGVKRFMKSKPTVKQAISKHNSMASGAESKRDVFRAMKHDDMANTMNQQAEKERKRADRIANKFATESKTKRTK